jgi:N-acylneuraminate cytidylyltransferase
VVFDFDGVMSDNRVLVMQDGTEGAICNRSDGLGIGMLKAAGMPMLVLSKEQNPVVGARCRKLGLECHQGIDDKLTRLREILGERALAMRDVAYVGNDINDLACMREVGMPIAVADAYPQVLAVAKMVTAKAGGHGAVREVCEALLAAMAVDG